MFQKFLDQTFLDNTVRNYFIVLLVVLVILIIKKILSRYLAGLIAILISRKNKPFNKERFQNQVLVPIEYFLIVLAIVIAFSSLNYPKVLDFDIHRIPLATVLESISNSALIASFIWLCIRLLEYVADILHEKALLTNDRADDQLIIFFKDFFKVIIFIIGLLLIIRFGFNKSIGNLLTGLSIVGAAVALAFRESLENLIASFIIFFDKPFTIGDSVKVQSVTGTVETIGLRSTRIRTTDKTYVTVPNKQMVDSILDNQSLRTQRKTENNILISLGATAEQLTAFIEQAEAILQKEFVLDSTVFLSDTGQQNSLVHIEYFTDVIQPIKDFQKLREKINLELLSALRGLDIDLAADNATIIVKNA